MKGVNNFLESVSIGGLSHISSSSKNAARHFFGYLLFYLVTFWPVLLSLSHLLNGTKIQLVEEQSATIKNLISKSEEVTKLNVRVNVIEQKSKEKEKARQLIEFQKNEVKILQDSIESLEKENKEKTETISQLEGDVFELKEMV